MMIRREFITLLGRAAVVNSVSWPLAARAQQTPSKIPVVGVLWHAGSAEEEEVYLSVLRKAFHDLGYIEGKNIQLEHRFPAENGLIGSGHWRESLSKGKLTPSSR